MCAGNQRRKQEHAAAEEQRRQDQIAAQRQAELNRLAAERQVTAAAQQAQLQAMEQQQAAIAAEQATKVAGLEDQQRERVGQIRATGQAVSSSLRILAGGGSTQAPTAAIAGSKKQGTTPRATTASLRMGATASRSGAGPNLPI